MTKFLKLLKISFKSDFSLFKINTKNSSKVNKVLLPLLIVFAMFYSLGYYYYEVAKVLRPLHLTYILLSMALILIFFFTVFETIYKSEGYLFEVKDNDLLLSLPLPKHYILMTRIIKLLAFETLYSLIFLLPALAIYIYFESPGISFYLITIFLILTFAIIPTIIGSFFGYLIKSFASHFKKKKVWQIIFSLLFTFAIFYLSYGINKLGNTIAKNALNINSIISKIYYPITLYQNMLTNFKLTDLFLYLVITIFPLFLFIYIMSINYFKIIQKSSDQALLSKSKNHKYSYHSPLMSIVIKEERRFLSSPIYILNTLIGMILLLGATIYFLINPTSLINIIVKNSSNNMNTVIFNNFPKIYLGVLAFFISLSSITSSSISLEGKCLNILKSLPISAKKVLQGKLLSSLSFLYPFILVSDLLLFNYLSKDFLLYLAIIIISIILPIIISILGLLINLKYPKLDFNSDTEVIKQSMSSMLSVLAGMLIATLFVILTTSLMSTLNFTLLIYLEILALIIILFLLYHLLMSRGVKEFNKL